MGHVPPKVYRVELKELGNLMDGEGLLRTLGFRLLFRNVPHASHFRGGELENE